MSACDAVRDEITAYLADELDAGAKGVVEAHLAGCATCTREVADMRTMIEMVTFGGLEHSPRSDLEDEVFQAVELETVARLVASAPLERDPPPDLERRALWNAGLLNGGRSRRSKVAAALVPSLAASVLVLGALGMNWRDDASDARATVDAWKGRYGPWGESMHEFQLADLSGQSVEATADAELVRAGDDSYTLILKLHGLEPSQPGYHYEVWLSGEDGRVPAGSFRVDTPGDVVRTFSIGVDPSVFPEVELVVEADAGSPAVTGPTIMYADLQLAD